MPMEGRELVPGGAKLGFRQRKLLAGAGIVAAAESPPKSRCAAGSMGPPPPVAKRKSDVAAGNECKSRSPRKEQQQQQQPSIKSTDFALLEEFYGALEQSIALLRIRSRPCTFAAVSESVESFTKRRFLRSHLARIKHIFPEVIECDSYSWKDIEHCCTKTDIRIRLLPFTPAAATVGTSASGISRKFSADTTYRRQEFHKRILSFEATHPEADDIPEAALLEEEKVIEEKDIVVEAEAPIDPNQFILTGKVTIKTGYQDIASRRVRTGDEINTSHFAASFKPFFSNKRSLFKEPPAPADTAAEQDAAEQNVAEQLSAEQDASLSTPVSRTSSQFTTPKTASPGMSRRSVTPKLKSPSVHDAGSVDNLPKLDTTRISPKRSSAVKSLRFGHEDSTPDDSNQFGLPDDSNRSLRFGQEESTLTDPNKQLLSSVSEELLQSVREKEKKAMEDKNSNVAEARRRQQMLAGLPQFFNMARSIYQSDGRSVMLHKELVKQISLSSTEITDEDEIDERIKLLLELAPEWIASKTSLAGEVMYRVQKSAEFSAIWKRLSSASSCS